MKKGKKSVKSVSYDHRVWISLGFLIYSPSLQAAAKPPANPGCQPPGTPTFTTPNPLRRVIIQPVGTKAFKLPNGNVVDFTPKPFTLPNGNMIDIGTDIQSILNTAVASTSNFAPSELNPNDPCDSHLEIRSALTTFQMDMAEFGITFGFTPQGSISPGLTNINGKAGVKIGTIAMDFSVWDCQGGQCTAVAASTANQATAKVDLSLTVDFTSITTGANFLYQTPMGDAIRKIMMDGLERLSGSPRVNELSWQATVMDYDASTGMLVFDAGFRDRLGTNQTFQVYAPSSNASIGICHVWESVANIHTVSVGTVSSTALVDSTNGSRGVRVGDIVLIRNASQK